MNFKILTLLSSGFLLLACSQKPHSSKEIINKSVAFHDPGNNWKNFKGKLFFESSFSFNDSVPEALELTFDIANQFFRYQNLDRKVDIIYNKDSCELASANGSCEGYSWTSKFYPFIWGLPMKINDPGVEPEKAFRVTNFNNKTVYEVRVNYTNENYWYYFNIDDYALEGFKFIKNDTTGKGEIIVLKDIEEFMEIRFPQHRTWLHLDSSLIGTNVLLKAENID